MTVLERIRGILESCSTEKPKLPPTILYNEGWLLRLVLDWFSAHRVLGHALEFEDGSRWYSEALLPSAFAAAYGGDPLAEGRTHADGVIGHFDIGVVGKGDLELRRGAQQLVIVEGKMFAALSAGITNASYFDQAARTVACMAEVLSGAERPAWKMSCLGFCVLAPREQIERGFFEEQVNKDSIGAKVKQRVDEWVEKHDDDKGHWLSDWFQPALDKLQLDVLSWEGVLATISEHDAEAGAALGAFYDRCLELN
jgi:hypothetical protein